MISRLPGPGRRLEVRVGGVVVHGHDAGMVGGQAARVEAGLDEGLDLVSVTGDARGAGAP